MNIEWDSWKDAVHVEKNERSRWSCELVSEAARLTEPDILYRASGDSMVLVVREPNGDISAYDLRVRRKAWVTR
jgi:hypothetical protein